MLAMQYRFVLPRDYDMEIIRTRIRTRGSALDGFPGLRFKAYLHGEAAWGEGQENSYCPFYVWEDSAALARFLEGPGFAGLTRDFGRPRIDTWIPWKLGQGQDFAGLRETMAWATVQRSGLPPQGALPELARQASAWVAACLEQGAGLAFSGFEPGGWDQIRVALWPDLPADLATLGCQTGQRLSLGHLSWGTEIRAVG